MRTQPLAVAGVDQKLTAEQGQSLGGGVQRGCGVAGHPMRARGSTQLEGT